jgi:hypothetical protein
MFKSDMIVLEFTPDRSVVPLELEISQRTNKKVSQGDSYNPEMKRRKQSICRPMCYLLLFI